MDKTIILKIFDDLDFKIIKDSELGDLVEMDEKNAFLFSSIVGSPYLISSYGVTMKGRCEVFIQRSIFSNGYYIYSPGLFSRNQKGYLTEDNSADKLLEKYPSVFKGKKYIYIHDVEISTLSNIESYVFNILRSKGKNPEDYILYKNFISGASAEPFYEYFASLNFIQKGYIVENQVPWFQQNLKYNDQILQGGIPDFSAFKCDLSSYLTSLGIISRNIGVSISLLPVIKNFQRLNEYKKNVNHTSDYELIVGEVKFSKSSLVGALRQLKKYNGVKLANELYTIIPDIKDNHVDDFGEIYLDHSSIKINKAKSKIEIDPARQKIDNNWLTVYIKTLLLANLPFAKIIKFIEDHRVAKNLTLLEAYEAIHLLDAVENSNNDSFFNYLTKNITYGVH
jgi:hypothetical protein